MVSVRSDGILIGSGAIHLQYLERFEHLLCFVIGIFYKGTQWRAFLNNQIRVAYKTRSGKLSNVQAESPRCFHGFALFHRFSKHVSEISVLEHFMSDITKQ